MSSAERHCSVFCLEMMIFNYERHRYCTLFTEAGDYKQDDAGFTDQAALASLPVVTSQPRPADAIFLRANRTQPPLSPTVGEFWGIYHFTE